MSVILLILVSIVGSIFNVVLSGFVLQQLWSWFIVPIFSVPALTIPYALGLSLLVGYLTHQDLSDLSKAERSRSPWEAVLTSLCKVALQALCVWGLGAVFHHFV